MHKKIKALTPHLHLERNVYFLYVFTTSIPIKLAGIEVLAGTYTLWTVPNAKGADLIVNKQAGQWGTQYNNSLNLGTAKMTSEALTSSVEEFTISINPVDKQHGALVMEWVRSNGRHR